MNKRKWYLILIISGLIGIIAFNYFANDRRLSRDMEFDFSREKPAGSEGNQYRLGSYAVASDDPIATEIGMTVLQSGGNAVDAAIAVSYSLGVLEPFSSGPGGGGLMLVHPSDSEEPVVYDYRETAPKSAEDPGNPIGVPGFILGMEIVHEDFGSIPIDELINPSVQLAEKGVPVSESLETQLKGAAYRMPVKELDIFYPEGRAIRSGEKLIQKELAQTLQLIQEKGASAFYDGPLSKKVADAADMKTDDLKSYMVMKTRPIKGTFGDYSVFTPPPPSGGLMLIQSLQMADELRAGKLDSGSAEYMHVLGEVSRRSYKNRLKYVGDPNYVDVPVNKLISASYTEEMIEDLELDKQTKEYLSPLDSKADLIDEGNTTHFVVVDANGMMVSSTNTLSNFFGSGKYVNGMFLNNQLDNFSKSKNSPNTYEPGKRPYSYTTPAILVKDGKPVIGIGSAGGRRITTTLLDVLVRIVLFDERLDATMGKSRFFVEYNKSTISLEKDVSKSVRNSLRKLDYKIDTSNSSTYFGSVQVLMADYERNSISGASDPRRGGNWLSKSVK